MRRCLLFVLALFSPLAAMAAEPVCYEYRRGTTGAFSGWPWSSMDEALAQMQAYCSASADNFRASICTSQPYPSGNYSRSIMFTSKISESATEVVWGYEWQRCDTSIPESCATGSSSMAFGKRVNPEGCPPSPCEQWLDVSASMEGAGALPGNVCRNMGDGSMCRFVPAGGVSLQVSSGWAAVFKGDGSECGASDNVGTAANCIMMESGKYACAGKPANPNCGKVNGEDVCLEKMPEGACAFMADGSVICDADAPNQPDNGTPGEQATPDAVLGLGAGEGAKEFNYYSSTTVAGSSGGGSGLSGVGPDAIGQDGGMGDGEGDGDGEGPGEICEGTDCYGEDGIGGQIAECSDDFEECITGFAGTLWETIEELPMMEFIASLHEAFGTTGACPEGSFTLWNETYDVMAPACGLITDHTGTFHLLFQVIWSLAGLRIILEG